MKPTNEYFPEGVTVALETTASPIFFQEQMIEKAAEFYRLLDNNSQHIEHPLHSESGYTPLRKGIGGEVSGSGIYINGTPINYAQNQSQWSITTPYDAYCHEGSGLTAVSSWLRCENPEGTRYDILLQTLRSSSSEPHAPLTTTEVANSIPVFIVPRKEDASFTAFLTIKLGTKGDRVLNELDALNTAQNESLLNSELEAMSKAFTY